VHHHSKQNSIDIPSAQREAAKMPHCPLEIVASAADNAAGAAYFARQSKQIRADLLQYGAIWFRGFTLMQTVPGFRDFYEALGHDPCLDPLHSSGLRKFASERDALYEEVNKASLRGHYIGLHCESTTKRTAAYAAFVCFQRATEGGGRFLVADGAAILAEMDTALLEKLYQRQIRISVSNLDLPPSLPGFMKQGFMGLVDAAVAPKFDMDLEMMFEKDGTPGRMQVSSDLWSGVVFVGVPSCVCLCQLPLFSHSPKNNRLSKWLNPPLTATPSRVYPFGSTMPTTTPASFAIAAPAAFPKWA
jgi:hypothetical protein